MSSSRNGLRKRPFCSSVQVAAIRWLHFQHWLNVFESQRVGQNQWRVSGVEFFPAPGADALTAYVYCEPLRTKVRSVPVSGPLTTIAQPVHEIVSHAVELLLEQIASKDITLDRRRVVLRAELVVRESCGARR